MDTTQNRGHIVAAALMVLALVVTGCDSPTGTSPGTSPDTSPGTSPGDDGSPSGVTTYTVSYDLNGGIGTVSAPASYDAEPLLSVSVSGNTPLAGPEIQDGIRQRFLGWAVARDAVVPTHREGDAISVTDLASSVGALTMYAIYTQDNEVIGKVGPAGGIVFYDTGPEGQSPYIEVGANTGVFRLWKRYLELCPDNLVDARRPSDLLHEGWAGGGGEIIKAQNQTIGSGEHNTQSIVAARPDDTDYVPAICWNYESTFNGTTFDDWFLPSSDELARAFSVAGAISSPKPIEDYINADQSIDPAVYTDVLAEIYWSSSESTEDSNKAWSVHGADGARYPSRKLRDVPLTRPVRVF